MSFSKSGSDSVSESDSVYESDSAAKAVQRNRESDSAAKIVREYFPETWLWNIEILE